MDNGDTLKKAKVAIVTDGTCSLTPAQGEEQIRGRFNYVGLVTSEMSPVIGVHAGLGTLGLVFYSLTD